MTAARPAAAPQQQKATAPTAARKGSNVTAPSAVQMGRDTISDSEAPTGRNMIAQGKERSDDALGHAPQTASSPERENQSGDLPKGWRWARLPELGELSRGKSKHRPRNDPKLYGGQHPFIQTGDVRESGGVIRAQTQTYSELGLAQSRLWPAGTMCITIAANIGETGILSYPACFPDSVVGFRHHGDPVTVRFIELYFRIAKTELEHLAPATAQKNINVDILSKLLIPLAPLPEQRRIVAEIEKQFTRLEAGVAALRRVQANLKRYRAAVLKAACEGRLVPTEAELQKSEDRGQKVKARYETGEALLGRILIERRQIHELAQADATRKKKYKEPTAPSIPMDEQLPGGWAWAAWDQIGFSQNGRPFPSAEYQETGFKLLRPGNLHVSGKVV